MDEANYISSNLDEGYSPEAIANMENALEELIVSLLSSEITSIRPKFAIVFILPPTEYKRHF